MLEFMLHILLILSFLPAKRNKEKKKKMKRFSHENKNKNKNNTRNSWEQWRKRLIALSEKSVRRGRENLLGWPKYFCLKAFYSSLRWLCLLVPFAVGGDVAPKKESRRNKLLQSFMACFSSVIHEVFLPLWYIFFMIMLNKFSLFQWFFAFRFLAQCINFALRFVNAFHWKISVFVVDLKGIKRIQEWLALWSVARRDGKIKASEPGKRLRFTT